MNHFEYGANPSLNSISVPYLYALLLLYDIRKRFEIFKYSSFTEEAFLIIQLRKVSWIVFSRTRLSLITAVYISLLKEILLYFPRFESTSRSIKSNRYDFPRYLPPDRNLILVYLQREQTHREWEKHHRCSILRLLLLRHGPSGSSGAFLEKLAGCPRDSRFLVAVIASGDSQPDRLRNKERLIKR